MRFSVRGERAKCFAARLGDFIAFAHLLDELLLLPFVVAVLSIVVVVVAPAALVVVVLPLVVVAFTVVIGHVKLCVYYQLWRESRTNNRIYLFGKRSLIFSYGTCEWRRGGGEL